MEWPHKGVETMAMQLKPGAYAVQAKLWFYSRMKIVWQEECMAHLVEVDMAHRDNQSVNWDVAPATAKGEKDLGLESDYRAANVTVK